MLKKIIDLILYSNFYIAVCAVALALQTQLLLLGKIAYSPVIGLIFFATLMIYATHRIVGLFRLKDFLEEGRYLVINKFKLHIWIYAALGLIGGVICFFQLNLNVQLALIVPAFLSLGYIFPVFGKKNALRLRDFNGVKIFLVASVWSYVTVLLPALYYETDFSITGWMLLERFLFIFAITLPFDIRDLEVDAFNKVKTIPAVLGIQKTLWLSILLLIAFLTITFFIYSWNIFLGMFIFSILAAIIILKSPQQQHDYYFTGLVDGTMILQPIIIYWLANL